MSSLVELTRPLINTNQDRVASSTLLARAARFPAAFVVHILAYARARRAMLRLRQNPSEVVRALIRARQILIVCHGNIIRSAFAARLLQLWLGPHCHVRVISAGVQAVPGQPPHPLALQVAGQMRVDLSRHSSTPISAENVGASDVIFAVDLIQLVALRLRFPDAHQKMFLLTCLAPATPLEIADPINGDEQAFQICFAHITKAVDHIRRVIAEPLLNR